MLLIFARVEKYGLAPIDLTNSLNENNFIHFAPVTNALTSHYQKDLVTSANIHDRENNQSLYNRYDVPARSAATIGVNEQALKNITVGFVLNKTLHHGPADQLGAKHTRVRFFDFSQS